MPALPYAHPELHEPERKPDWNGVASALFDAVVSVVAIVVALFTIHPHGFGAYVFPVLLAIAAFDGWNGLVDAFYAWTAPVQDYSDHVDGAA